MSSNETLKIIDSPAGLNFQFNKTGTAFAIYPNGFINDPDDTRSFVFTSHLDQYILISKTGFKTNQEHLDWLIGLGKIKMIEETRVFGKESVVVTGYVSFVDSRK
jgi:hypothetical protein